MKINCLDDMRIVFHDERVRRGISKTEFPPLTRKAVDDFENGRSGDAKAETIFALMKGLGWSLAIDMGEGFEPDDFQDDIDLGTGLGR
jgi:hypothetical protein